MAIAGGKLLLSSVYFPVFLLLLCSDIVICHSDVRSLPGFTGSLPFELETGYLGADEFNDVVLFYYFIKSERNPSEDPLILWISGGPGCSGIVGLATEIGPVYFKNAEYNGTLPSLELNPNSWTKVSNIIFIDAPVGTGFSYSSSLQGSHTGDIKSALQTYTFLKKWFGDHPDFLSNPLYIGGDSYSGLTIPIIVQDISDGNKAGDKPFMNLKGYLLGNPLTDRNFEENSRIPFFHESLDCIGYFQSTKNSCSGEYVHVDPSNTACLEKLQAVNDCSAGLNPQHVLEPLCFLDSPKPKDIVGQRRSLNDNSSKFFHSPPLVPGLECRSYRYMLAYYWANDDRVQNALNIRKGKVQEWLRCNRKLPYYSHDVESSLKYHQSLSKRSYRSLIYSGDHDFLAPFLGTQAWIKSLNYFIIDDWRPWIVDGQVAGYTRTYANSMTFATVKGGHTAPEYRPSECLAMLERWISHNPL